MTRAKMLSTNSKCNGGWARSREFVHNAQTSVVLGPDSEWVWNSLNSFEGSKKT